MSDKGDVPITLTLRVYSVSESIPDRGEPVLVFHKAGVDTGARYGDVWRLMEFGEEQLYDVTHWAELPNIDDLQSPETKA